MMRSRIWEDRMRLGKCLVAFRSFCMRRRREWRSFSFTGKISDLITARRFTKKNQMKPQILRALNAVFVALPLLTFIGPQFVSLAATCTASPVRAGSGLKFPGPDDQFIVYYNIWPDDDEFYKRMGGRYKLIILNTNDLVPPKAIKKKPAKPRSYKQHPTTMLRHPGT